MKGHAERAMSCLCVVFVLSPDWLNVASCLVFVLFCGVNVTVTYYTLRFAHTSVTSCSCNMKPYYKISCGILDNSTPHFFADT